MSQSIRLSDELIEAARSSAGLYHRSPPQQLEYWAALGRVMETALDFPSEVKVLEAVGRADLERALGEVETKEGADKAREVIRRSSGSIVSRSNSSS